jgi:amino acid permease
MSQRVSRTDIRRNKRNKRLIVLAWIVALATLVIFLLYKEKSDWLYVLATLGVTVLLVIVAVSDLHYGERKGVEATSLGDDAAAIGSGIVATAAATAAPSDFRGAKTRRK